MSEAKAALVRLETALDALETAFDRVKYSPGTGQTGDGEDERRALARRVRELEAQSREDAILRVEAADAVRAALRDLRAVATRGGAAHG